MTPASPARVPRDNSDAELDAVLELGKRLGGFDPAISAEWIDGALTALMAGPRVPASPAEAVDALFGDTWARTFADPDDVARALAVLDARWQVLRTQLDPDAIDADPSMLRLAPLMLDAGDAQQPLVPARPAAADAIDPVIGPPGLGAETVARAGDPADADGQTSDEACDDGAPDPGDEDEPQDEGDEGGLRHGEDWARGVLAVVESPDLGWDGVPGDDRGELATLLQPVHALTLPTPLLPAWVAMRYPGEDPATLTREDLEADACYALQALRLWWMDHAPRTAPRRAVPTPGRNDPCPCGSGRKYKKCHGAAG